MALQEYLFARNSPDRFVKRVIAATVAFAAVTVGLVSGSTNALAAGGYQAPIRSGLAWPSGVFVPSYDLADNTSFEGYRGRPIDVSITWPPRQTWDNFIKSNVAYTSHQGAPYTTVFGIPPIPEDAGQNATMAGCAAGSYNSKWTTFGQTLTGLGLGSSIIRLGWEMNGDWYVWGGGDPTTFANCYKQIVTTVRAVAPNLKFEWTINRGSSAGMPGDAVLAAYPGDAYVDIVGIDNYDTWNDWNTQLNGSQGLKYWLNFAVAHGKKLAIPEWGLFAADRNQGHGDSPTFIQNMYDFFKANASNIAYEAYFNEGADYVKGSLWDPIQMPNSSAKYQALYKSTESPGITASIQDTAVGTTVGKVEFSANWGQCTTNCTNAPDNSYLWTATAGSTATVRFSGRQVKWFGMKEPFSMIATVAIDGGTPVDVDPYSATTSVGVVELYSSPVLTEGTHTLVITMTGRRNPASAGGSSITFDRADVISAPTTTTSIQDTAVGTTVGKVEFSANWGQCTTNCTNAPDNSYLWTATAGSTATVRFSGRQVKWFGMKEPFSMIATVAIDGGTPVDVDPYSATTSVGVVELYSSPVLTEGTHTLVITMTGRRNPASAGGSSITFDRADVVSG